MDAVAGIAREHLLWALGSLCAVHRMPFDADLALQQFPPPHDLPHLLHATRALGFRSILRSVAAGRLARQVFPCLAVMRRCDAGAGLPDNAGGSCNEASGSAAADENPPKAALALLLKCDAERMLLIEAGDPAPRVVTLAEFDQHYDGQVILCHPVARPVRDDDGEPTRQPFGFRWFLPELLKHRSIWRDVLLASLAIQLMALATPLFTQVIIDKVVVHQTLSTLTVIGVALLVFMLFTAAMSWVRQYLVLHTGNRVDAVLGSQVFEHLIELPPRYFEQRPTGVVVARLHAVETVRDFIAGAAVTLILDIPFLIIFLAVMFHYSVPLTAVSVAILGSIVVVSLMVTPLLKARLNRQFLLGARNQAFLTEYVAGIETVKSLQMEPQLKQRYGEYLASYLHAGFRTRQLSNTYNTTAHALEQLMTLFILWLGAYLVMTTHGFTIGMLVAFQMFASRLSQPLLRMVGLWQQFQEANIAVQRLGDIMNVPAEPYALTPSRENIAHGRIEFRNVAFRHHEQLSYLYRNLNLQLKPGHCVALIGPSGSGKSTLARLIQGFYQPSDGQILLDGRDIRHLSANELRQSFGVVPQDTVLFSGSVYDNLLLANPHATFEQVVAVCKLAEIHDTIEKLPQGYQTEIGERGTGLSGGQKQRLAIARALLKGPRVLIFDEATSGLDPVTTEQLARTINTFRGRVSVLFIAHHLPKGLHIDEVIRLGGDPARDEQHMSILTPSPRSRGEGGGQYDPPLAPSGERGGGEGRFSDNSHQAP